MFITSGYKKHIKTNVVKTLKSLMNSVTNFFNKNNGLNLSIIIVSILLFIIGYNFFSMFIKHRMIDIYTHCQMLEQYIKNQSLPGNFIYYLIIYIFSGFATSAEQFGIIAPYILSFALTGKYLVSYHFLTFSNSEKFNNHHAKILGLIFIFLLLFYHPLPDSLNIHDHLYLGKIPVNIWHNSTTIFLMPFAILLFFLNVQYFLHPDRQKLIWLTILIIVNIYIKPSFFLVLLIAYPVFGLFYLKSLKKYLLSLIPVFAGLIFLYLQYLYIYRFDDLIYHNKIAIKPFFVWNLFSGNKLTDLLLSCLMPILVLLFYFRQSIKDIYFKYSLVLFLISFLIFILLIEDGSRLNHGNFLWQAIICNYLLHLTSFRIIYKNFIEEWSKNSIKEIIIIILILSSFACEIFYLTKILIFKDIA